MKKTIKKPIVYVSHPIQGESGDMEGNCGKAIRMVKKLRKVFPEIHWYCPAESDWILQILWNNKKISTKDILWADCEILKECHGWIFLHWEESGGSEVERQKAIVCGLIENLNCDICDDVTKMSYQSIRKRFSPIADRAVVRHRQ